MSRRSAFETAIRAALGADVINDRPLAGGCVGDVRGVELDDGRRIVTKFANSDDPALDVEGWMLDYLREHAPELPVPRVLHAEPELLVMDWLPGTTGVLPGPAEDDAARHLAGLHTVHAPRFGLERDTRIGSLPQPNPWADSWLEFFGAQRVLPLARELCERGMLDGSAIRLFERVVSRLDRWLDEPSAPTLLHGDVWSGNLLSTGDRVTGFLDPAISYGHPEIELAFTTLFSTFSDRFYDCYGEHRGEPLDRGFFLERSHLYNLYPLLVHARLFAGSYVDRVVAVAERFA